VPRPEAWFESVWAAYRKDKVVADDPVVADNPVAAKEE
jgi:hypothetical protein